MNIKEKFTKNTFTGAIVKTAQDESSNRDVAFYFDIITDHSVNISNSITDNFLENNTAIQDTIAHAPLTISLSGLIGELVYVPSTNNPRFLNRFYSLLNEDKQNTVRDYITTDKLSSIAQLYPPVDNITQLAKNVAVYVEDTVDRYKKIYKNFKRNMNDNTRLRDVYIKLMKLRDNNDELIVTTPFGVFTNMYIQSISMTQGNENHVANISIELKQLSFTELEITTANADVLAKYNAAAQAQTENNGKASGISKDSAIGDFIHKVTGKEPFILKQ